MQPNLSRFSAQNHPLTEDFDIARFSIDQISLLVKKNGIDQTNRLTLEDRRDGERETKTASGFSKVQTAVSSVSLPTAYHMKKVQHTAHFLIHCLT